MKPLVFIDCETTGIEPATDRIVSLAIIRFTPGEPHRERYWLINPGVPIPEAASKIHGIHDDDVAGLITFAIRAKGILNELSGCDLAGDNIINFDVPLLAQEFERAGIDWRPGGAVIDILAIDRKKRPRKLADLVEHYCGRPLPNAHSAMVDAKASMDVLFSQLQRYGDLAAMERGELGAFCADGRVDLAGKLVRDEAGEVRFNFGKHRGQRVIDQRGYAEWMLGASFTKDTKFQVAAILNGGAR